MKRFIAVLLTATVVLSLCACGKSKEGDLGKQTTIDKENGYTIVEEVLTFKYNTVEDEVKTDPNALTSGFVTDESNATGKVSTKSDALNVAKKEVTDNYNKINFAYDRTRGVWKVSFSVDTVDAESGTVTSNTPVMTVYVDEDGYTLATVKGE